MMNKEKIITILNQAIEREIGAIFQYMGQHYRFPKRTHPIAREMLERIAIEEMKHAETFSKRVVALGGQEGVKVGKVIWEKDFFKMLESDMAVEEEAIAMYKKHIAICEEEGDLETKAIYEEILADEERHQKLFGTLKKMLSSEIEGK